MNRRTGIRGVTPIRAVLAALFLLGASLGSAQEDESGRMAFTAGLVIETVDKGEPWAYVAWRTTEPDLLFQQPVGVFAKPGVPESAGAYERVSVVNVQTEPPVLSAIVSRAERLGESRAELEERVEAVFQDLIPNPDWGIGEKLSAVILGAIADPVVQENLLVLSEGSPALSMAVGRAYAAPLDEITTYEIRELDETGTETVRVFGRATVDPNNPEILPAPGAPLDVTAPGAKGHLNVRLLWSQPESLLHRMPLHGGFNVYRVEREFAESEGWNREPPDFANPESNFENPERIDEPGWDAVPEVVRANRLPVMAREILTEADVTEIAGTDPEDRDEDRFFYTDDNDRAPDGANGFEDGEQFYYFVTATDLLGTDGVSSPGTLVTVCSKLPPVAPVDVGVDNVFEYEGGEGEQFLRVRWRQNDEDDPRAEAANYYVYRWDSIPEIHEKAGDPAANLIAGPIPHVPGREFGRIDDTGAGAPTIEEDAGRTFWYTVRAEDNSVCGGNLSGNSGPVPGVLRDREGPGSQSGGLEISCLVPEVLERQRPNLGGVAGSLSSMEILIEVERTHPAIEWVEFSYPFHGQIHSLGRVYFEDGEDTVEFLESINVGDKYAGQGMLLRARAGTNSGDVSAPWQEQIPLWPGGRTDLGLEARAEFVRGAKGEDCFTHTSRDPGVADGSNDVQPVGGFMEIPEGTREWKLYRRVDEGSLTLIDQGDDSYEDATEIPWEDAAMPASAFTRLCYYGQVFDEHGNAGPLVRLDCVDAKHSDLPVPILASVTAREEDGEGRRNMRLRWFCPPAGVERFEVLLTPAGRAAETESDLLQGPLSVEPVLLPLEMGDGGDGPFGIVPLFLREHHIFQTPRIAGGFGDGAEFVVDVAVEPGVEYEAVVRAVGPGPFAVDESQASGYEPPQTRVTGSLSNRLAFSWSAPDPDADPEETPWPERPVPDAAELAQLNERIEAGNYEIGDEQYLAIKLGEFRYEVQLSDIGSFPFPNTFPPGTRPEQMLFSMGDSGDANADSGLLPFVVYRVPVSSAGIGVFGDTPVPATFTQVSPRINELAYEENYEFTFEHETIVVNLLRDSRFIFEPIEDPDEEGPTHRVLFIDHHPFIGGTEYRYLLVHFRPDGEIGRVFVSPPFNP